MSILSTRPALRWAVPTAAALVVGMALGPGLPLGANADDSLGTRTPAELIADVRSARLTGLSGTVVQTSDLGLPDLGALAAMGGRGAAGAGTGPLLLDALTGTQTWRLWYAGPDKARVALVGDGAESDLVVNGRDAWVWASNERTATHVTLADGAGTPRPAITPTATLSPQALADQALAALDPTTEVTSPGTTTVAGRPAYELVLTPRTPGTLVAKVTIAVDGAQRVPTRVRVYSTKTAQPAIEVAFSSVDFSVPDARTFSFTPPPGTTVTDQSLGRLSGRLPDQMQGDGPTGGAKIPGPGTSADAGGAPAPRIVGTGWASVVVAGLPAGAFTGSASPSPSDSPAAGEQPLDAVRSVLEQLPTVSGSWGSGRVFSGTLFSVVLSDDGRIAVGAVAPERLFEALGTR